jgi:hypothetical protein
MVLHTVGINFPSNSNPPNIGESSNPNAQQFYDLLMVANTSLRDGYTNRSELSIVARLLNIKSEKCFNEIVQLMKEVMPIGNKMLDEFYRIKKLVAILRLPVQKIDICVNGCMLYW